MSLLSKVRKIQQSMLGDAIRGRKPWPYPSLSLGSFSGTSTFLCLSWFFCHRQHPSVTPLSWGDRGGCGSCLDVVAVRFESLMLILQELVSIVRRTSVACCLGDGEKLKAAGPGPREKKTEDCCSKVLWISRQCRETSKPNKPFVATETADPEASPVCSPFYRAVRTAIRGLSMNDFPPKLSTLILHSCPFHRWTFLICSIISINNIRAGHVLHTCNSSIGAEAGGLGVGGQPGIRNEF